MNVLFLGLSPIESLKQKEMYPELLSEFKKNGHNIYAVTNYERRTRKKTALYYEDNAQLLVVKTLNIQKTNLFEKGIGTILLPIQYKKAIRKFFNVFNFDLILYPTPPITIYSVVNYLKKHFNCKTYLMLKDIFPQNAVDLGILPTKGYKKYIYKYFRNKEKKLYKISDYIGCMSPKNVEYILEHNQELSRNQVGLCPNCIDTQNFEPVNLNIRNKKVIREKYGLPFDNTIFIYGGNLGKPQGIPFIIDCLKSQTNNGKVYFVIVGDGTEFHTIEEYSNESKQNNLKVIRTLPKEEFEMLAAACDVGLIFLDYRFTIPNFPSRLLSYMKAGLPVLSCTDINTDVGQVIVDNGFGWSCSSNDINGFFSIVESLTKNGVPNVKNEELQFLINNYSTKIAYKLIVNQLQ